MTWKIFNEQRRSTMNAEIKPSTLTPTGRYLSPREFEVAVAIANGTSPTTIKLVNKFLMRSIMKFSVIDRS